MVEVEEEDSSLRFTLSPSPEVDNNRLLATTRDDPKDFFVAIIGFLMFGVSGNQGEIARTELFSRRAAFSDNSSMAGCCIDDCVWYVVRRYRG